MLRFFTIFLFLSPQLLLAENKIITVTNSYEVNEAFNKLEDNTTIKFAAGTYRTNVTIDGKKNITLQAVTPGSVMLNLAGFTPLARLVRTDLTECQADPHLDKCTWTPECLCDWKPIYPENSQNLAIINIMNSSNITIEGLTLLYGSSANISISNSQNITINNVDFFGSTYAIHADGENTKTIHVTNSSWVQDTSEGNILWNILSWEHAHHGYGYFLNGAFFGSINIAGDILIAHNKIRDAFNVVRMNFKPERCTHSLCANNINRDVFVIENTMHRIRDNAIEPEKLANGTWVIANNLIEAHADISLDNVHNPDQKGLFLLSGNTNTKITRPSLIPGPAVRESGINNWGKVLKLPKKALNIPTIDGGTEKEVPYLNLVLQHNNFDVHRELADGQNVKFLKGVLPRGTDLASWGGNFIIGKCKVKLRNDTHTEEEICSALVQDVTVHFNSEEWLAQP